VRRGYSGVRARSAAHVIENSAIAVKAYFVDGEVLAYVPYELYSPGGPQDPLSEGRTDRGGCVAFVPDTPGPWRLKITTLPARF